MKKVANNLIADFMGYKYHEIADIDYSDCGGIYTRQDVYSKTPILINKYPEDDQYYLDDKWNPEIGSVIYGELKYHTSWDWLMPVVEKITKIHEEKFKYDPIEMAKGNFPEDDEYMNVIALSLATPITEVYESAGEFIKWYNSQKPRT